MNWLLMGVIVLIGLPHALHRSEVIEDERVIDARHGRELAKPRPLDASGFERLYSAGPPFSERERNPSILLHASLAWSGR